MTYNPFSLEGKKILVTGASSGIGKETAIACSRMGAELIISGRNAERLNQTFVDLDGAGQRNHVQIPADLLVQSDFDNLVAQTDSINGLVMSVGIPYYSPVQFCTPDKFQKVFQSNFFSTIELIRVLYQQKKLVNGSSIVVISSVAAIRSDFGSLLYGTSKAALNSMMKICAKVFAVKGIRINTLMPGMIPTPCSLATWTPEQLQEDTKHYPLKRLGRTEDVANGAIYLLSDASSWVTGTSIVIDGGLTL